jgi:hypothetical protein
MNRHLWLCYGARDGSAAFFFSILTFSVLDAPWIVSFVLQNRDSQITLTIQVFILISTVSSIFERTDFGKRAYKLLAKRVRGGD